MPDFFEPDEPWPADKFPPANDEEGQKLQAFFGGPANPAKSVAGLKKVAEALKAEGAKKVVAYGFCWGSCRVTVEERIGRRD
jgi:dienelactone hydrolase